MVEIALAAGLGVTSAWGVRWVTQRLSDRSCGWRQSPRHCPGGQRLRTHRHRAVGLTGATTAFTRCGDPRLGGDRRRPGRAVDVVPPAAPRHRPRRARRRRGAGRRLAAPVGLADDARRARHRRAARRRAARPSDGRANEVVPAYFADYERAHRLPVLRPVRVDEVAEADDGLLEVRAGDRRWLTRTIVNATGTWSRPFVPALPGRRDVPRPAAAHPRLPGPEQFRGKRVVVVGGGASAVQLLGEIAPVAADTLWVTRRAAGLAHRRLHSRGRAGGGRAGRGAGTPWAAAGQRRERHRAGAARAGARGRAARRLRAAPDVRRPSSPTACGCRTARTGRPT